ncbi:MAG: nitrous oxide reductase family maturation protein NosD, partial [Halobacteriaceae archaeon]
VSRLLAWNTSTRGNYWGKARPSDVDHDGINEVAYRPSGLADRLVRRHPRIAVFTKSPAFDAIRLAQSTLPVIESNGVVDYHPLSRSPHDWREYYERDRSD